MLYDNGGQLLHTAQVTEPWQVSSVTITLTFKTSKRVRNMVELDSLGMQLIGIEGLLKVRMKRKLKKRKCLLIPSNNAAYVYDIDFKFCRHKIWFR